MNKTKLIAAACAALILTGCAAPRIEDQQATRLDNTALFFHNDPNVHGAVEDQADALHVSAKRLVRQSTVKGALAGAALGCGLTVLSGSNGQSCVQTAALAGAGGAVIGNARGKRDVARRVELVSANGIVTSLRTSRKQIANVKSALPRFLADQEAELNALTLQRAKGTIDQATYEADMTRIEQDRADLAHALTLSASEARQATENLRAAKAHGQSGLDWHIGAANDLADDIASARASITLL